MKKWHPQHAAANRDVAFGRGRRKRGLGWNENIEKTIRESVDEGIPIDKIIRGVLEVTLSKDIQRVTEYYERYVKQRKEAQRKAQRKVKAVNMEIG